MGDVFHPDGAVVVDFGMVYGEFTGHKGDVVGACHVPFRIKTTAVDKGGVFHAEPSGTLVHLTDEFGFGTAEIFRHGDAGIVGARNADTFDHGLYGLGLPRL